MQIFLVIIFKFGNISVIYTTMLRPLLKACLNKYFCQHCWIMDEYFMLWCDITRGTNLEDKNICTSLLV